jgi:hypothetical protein
MHRTVAAAIVAALALAVASCGGSEKTTLSGAALVRRVELACRSAQRESERAAREAARSDPFAGIRAGQRFLVDELDGLDASGAAKADFNTFKEGVRERFDAIETVASADREDRNRALRSVQRSATAASERIESAARRLRLDGCS